MMNHDQPRGVTFCEEDRSGNRFMIRQSGTNNFVTKINHDIVSFADGWDNPENICFGSLDEALEAAVTAYRVEGLHLSVELKD